MIRTAKSIFLAIGFLVIISFLLPGCYTQFSRPQVDTDDEYYDNSEYEDAEEYYQDEGVPSVDDSRDVYIYNYYPNSWYDYWYGGYYNYPNRWAYMGPYPDYWWDPYGRWWTPGWYIGFSYYDYYWGGYSRHYNSYYGYGYDAGNSRRSFSKRPFDRRSIGLVDRNRRIDTQSTLAKPITPSRVERPGTTLSTPIVRDKSLAPDRKSRTVKEMVDQRLRSRTKTSQLPDEAKKPTVRQQRSDVQTPRTVKNPPRSSKTITKPNIIERAPQKSTPQKSNSVPKRSSNRKSKSISRPSDSGSKSISKPSTKSYTPQSSSSSSRSTTRSTPTRSSSGKSSSGSKSSGSSSRTKK